MSHSYNLDAFNDPLLIGLWCLNSNEIYQAAVPQLSMDHNNSMGSIFSATRQEQQPKSLLPFEITGQSRIRLNPTLSGHPAEYDTERISSAVAEDPGREERVKEKARRRLRVNIKDETPADVSEFSISG